MLHSILCDFPYVLLVHIGMDRSIIYVPDRHGIRVSDLSCKSRLNMNPAPNEESFLIFFLFSDRILLSL